MEVRYPVKVLYTLGTSQLMLARADAIECRPVKPRPNSTNPEVKHASTTLKECLSALCRASPELLADPRTDHSVYALDPLQTPELMVGRGLLTWLMAESGRVVGTIQEDYVDGEEMEVLEIRFSLTPTIAVSRAQHASSLQNISQPAAPVTPANLSPPSTPSGQSQSTRASTRLRIKSSSRAKEKAAAAAAAPTGTKKRGRQKAPGPSAQAPSTPVPIAPTPSAQDTPVARPSTASPLPSRSHSRVSSVPSLALSQTQAPSQSQPRPPTPCASTPTTASVQPPQPSRPPSQPPQSYSPGQSLARLLLAASDSSSNSSGLSGAGTPLIDNLIEKIKSTGLVPGSGESTATDEQKQALLRLIAKINGPSSVQKGQGREGGGEGKVQPTDERVESLVTSPNLAGLRSPMIHPSPSPAPSSTAFSAPSPAALAAPSPSSFATPVPPPDSNLGTRKRESGDQSNTTDSKRARFGLAEARTSSIASLGSHLAKGLKLEDGSYVFSPTSPSPSVASPSLSAASPNITAPSPNLSAASAPSPNLAVVSPSISAASPYSYPHSASAPSNAPLGSLVTHSGSGTWPSSQPTPSSQPESPPLPSASSQPSSNSRSISQPNLFSSESKPTSNTRKRAPRETPLHAQTDLPLVSGPFVTPRDQIGLPRVPAPPSPAKCVAGPGRAKGSGPKKDKKQEVDRGTLVSNDHEQGQGTVESEKQRGKAKAEDKVRRGISEDEVRVMLADGYYPPGGLGAEHRRLFGAKNGIEDRGSREPEGTGIGPTSETNPPPAPINNCYRTAGSSKYYRTSDSADYPAESQSFKSATIVSRKAPPIPKHSPVALPAISRLPMMMTSPIRATAGRDPDPEPEKGRKSKAQKSKGVKPPEPRPTSTVEQPPREFPPSLNEYSPLRRLLKNAGMGSLADVLGSGGILGLKGDGGQAGGNPSDGNTSRAGAKAEMIKEQEREVVDLTSDAEEEDISVPVKAPALAGKSRHEPRPEPRTPPHQIGATTVSTTPPRVQQIQPRFSTPRRAGARPLAPPRLARTSPDREESPLFGEVETPVTTDAYTQDPSSEALSIPLDLPPSSPPPMSDSDLEAGSGADVDAKAEYREASRYTDGESSEAGFSLGADIEDSDVERPPDPSAELEDDTEGGWDETIRPLESGVGEPEAGLQNGALLNGLSATGETELDLDMFANFLDMLSGEVGVETDGEPGNSEQLGTGLDALAEPTNIGLDPSVLDFSWLDALGSGDPGEATFEVGEIGAEGEFTGQDLAEILAALGAG
ncbi:hypothetical protein FRC12_001312 [Ceratobasidium sp. 428]|nr:hypothetical protein FRC12_001312 [Ceratobasidium sp. 428]